MFRVNHEGFHQNDYVENEKAIYQILMQLGKDLDKIEPINQYSKPQRGKL